MGNPIDISKLNIGNYMKDIGKEILDSADGDKITVDCPHCNREINISLGKSKCPRCGGEINLSISLN